MLHTNHIFFLPINLISFTNSFSLATNRARVKMSLSVSTLNSLKNFQLDLWNRKKSSQNLTLYPPYIQRKNVTGLINKFYSITRMSSIKKEASKTRAINKISYTSIPAFFFQKFKYFFFFSFFPIQERGAYTITRDLFTPCWTSSHPLLSYHPLHLFSYPFSPSSSKLSCGPWG